jgi:hypothetical protein
MNSTFMAIKKPTRIMEGLYLGGENEANNLAILKNLGIKYILVCGRNLTCPFPDVKFF